MTEEASVSDAPPRDDIIDIINNVEEPVKEEIKEKN